MWLANEATMTRPGARANMLSRARPHASLRLGEARVVGVGAVGQQEQHSLAAELGEPLHRRRAEVDGGLVELEVAGVDHGPDRGVDAQAHPVGDAVTHLEELQHERPQRERLGAGYLVERHLALQPVLAQLGVHQPQGEPGAVDRACRPP